MTESMIEAVAKAMAPQWWDIADNDDALPPGTVEMHKARYRRLARAAIEAMREPTDEQIEAVPPQFFRLEHFYGTGHHANVPGLMSGPKQVWQAMIDEALKVK